MSEWTWSLDARDRQSMFRETSRFLRGSFSPELGVPVSFILFLHSEPTTLSTFTFAMPNPRTFFDITIGGEPIGRIVFELVM